MKHTAQTALGAIAALCAVGISVPATAAWEPVRPVEFIVPAGTGGGADQMARTIQGIVTKHNLMKQPMVVINKSGGAGGEGFLDLKASGGNPHKIIITLSNLFTTPLATGIPFNWKDLTPVAMLALDEFVLWVNAEQAVQDGEGLCRCGEGRARGHHQDGRHRLEAGRPDHHGRASKRPPAPSSPTFPTRAAAKSPFSWSATTSIRPSTIRSRRSRNGAAASCVRSACSTRSRWPMTSRSPTARAGRIFRPASRRASTSNI